LANRLSYFLWKSPPDVTLRDEAKVGQLNVVGNLREQVDRLIDSPRFRLFVRDFAAQWLRLQDIDATTPDDVLYPEYNDVLRQAMLDETVYYLEYLFRENMDVTYLIDADFTFLNRELASHYNLTGVKGQHMRRHPLPKFNPRGGLLAQAAVHKVTANGTATSPVRRGNFVLSQLLGIPSPPLPPKQGRLSRIFVVQPQFGSDWRPIASNRLAIGATNSSIPPVLPWKASIRSDVFVSSIVSYL
jgi:hypothetical protein